MSTEWHGRMWQRLREIVVSDAMAHMRRNLDRYADGELPSWFDNRFDWAYDDLIGTDGILEAGTEVPDDVLLWAILEFVSIEDPGAEGIVGQGDDGRACAECVAKFDMLYEDETRETLERAFGIMMRER